jgi:hypothetical protein
MSEAAIVWAAWVALTIVVVFNLAVVAAYTF